MGSSPKSPDLLFVTNPDNGEPEEDIFLEEKLREAFYVTRATPRTAIKQLPNFQRCLIRNAWPSREFAPELKRIEDIVRIHGIKLYNPIHRGYVEDKSYIVRLWDDGYPVIPTVDSPDDLDRLPVSLSYIIKPNDGCSSEGIKRLRHEEILTHGIKGYLLQPEIDIQEEVSFYFIDDQFKYSMVSAGKKRRWELTEYRPSPEEIEWAMRFVRWNAMPYGIQRIDAARTCSNDLLLMEVEDHMCLLSLLELSEMTRKKACEALLRSLKENLC